MTTQNTCRLAPAARICALTLSLLAPLAGPARADVLYVDAAATAPGDGSQGSPFPAIQTAIDALAQGAPPHWIWVAPGSYAGFDAGALGVATSIVATGGPEDTGVGPVQLAAGLFLNGFDIDGQGGVAVQAPTAPIVERCVLRNATTGYDAPQGGSLWTASVVHCGVGIAGVNDLTDTVFFANGLDIQSNLSINCSNIWQSWLHPTQGLLSQDIDPKFWDIEAEDLHLRLQSPCINAGCWVTDIGAFPYDPNYAPDPQVYCTAKTSFDLCTTSLSWSGPGHASLSSPAAFVISATGVSENKNGLFIYSSSAASLPALGGTLCVGSPLRRTFVQSSGSGGGACTGRLDFDFNAYAQSGSAQGLQPGTWLYGQYWMRDPQGSFGSALSQGVRFALLP